MSERANRRLAAILAADVAGYTRMVQQDEEGTVRAWQSCRAALIDPAIDRFGGRIANTAGDSLLAEFPSAVDAARCALEIQTGLANRAATSSSGPAISLRIGLNVGDVIADGGDLLGDGVNIAARLEQAAEPGSVLASAVFADHVRDRADIGFRPMGAKRLKNVTKPVEAFAVVPQSGAISGRAVRTGRSRTRLLGLIALVVAVIAGASLLWLQPWRPDMKPAQMNRMAFPLPDKPSVAVVPFKTFSDETLYLADGLTDDLITDLSKVSGLFVIAGNTSFSMRNAEMDVAGFSEAVGVRYVIEGGLRRTGQDLRVNARLVDATTGRLMWAHRYEGTVEDVFDIQTELTMEVTTALGVAVPEDEMAQIVRTDTKMVEAREAFQRGWALYSKFNERDNAASIPHFERAAELDPDYGRAYAALALAHLRPHLFHHWNNYLTARDGLHITSFYKYLKKASEYDTSLVHVVRAMVRLNLRDIAMPTGEDNGPEAARLEAASAIALNPNDPEAHIAMAWALIAGGAPSEGLAFVKSAMRLDPAYPIHYTLFRAAGLYAMGESEAAAEALSAGLARDPHAVELLPVKASLLAQLGQRKEARTLLERWHPGENRAALDSAVDDYFFIVRWPGDQAVLNRRLKDGLRLAALPGSVTVSSLRFDLASDPVRQLAAVRALALFGPSAADAVPALVELLHTDSAILRKSVVETLGRIGPAARAAIPALEAMSGPDLIGNYAIRALRLIREE